MTTSLNYQQILLQTDSKLHEDPESYQSKGHVRFTDSVINQPRLIFYCVPSGPSSWPEEEAGVQVFTVVTVKSSNTEVFHHKQIPSSSLLVLVLYHLSQHFYLSHLSNTPQEKGHYQLLDTV